MHCDRRRQPRLQLDEPVTWFYEAVAKRDRKGRLFTKNVNDDGWF